jgi:hypothetical protein
MKKGPSCRADLAGCEHPRSALIELRALVPDVGFFARAGASNGAIEPYEFTDIDQTSAAGLSFGGKRWGRPDDTFGVAGIINAVIPYP